MKRKIIISSITLGVLLLTIAFSCKKKDSDSSSQYTIGQSYGGGIVFYIDGTGEHGLVAATSDQSTSSKWGCMGTSVPGAVDSIVGVGLSNTTSIINTCTTANIAAKICNDLVLNGYSDWFLPSKGELDLIYSQKSLIGGFSIYGYWSSTERGNGTAWVQYMSSGQKMTFNKSDACCVRAIRAF